MQLNLKDPETNAMVERLSAVTGVNKARAVKEAVRDKLASVDRMREEDIQRRMAAVRVLTAQIRAKMPKPLPTQQELDDEMYGKTGFPVDRRQFGALGDCPARGR